MTDTIGAPAAAAKVRASWKLIPHSACPAPIKRLGGRAAVGQDLEVDAGIAVPAVRRLPRRSPVWFVFGVQSSASRTVPSGACEADAAGEADGAADGDAGRADGDRRCPTASPPASRPGFPRRGPHDAAMSATPKAAASNRFMRSSAGWMVIEAPVATEHAKRRLQGSGDGVNESTGLLPSPVLAGSGSAGLWRLPHSQRTRRSPEAVFGCRPMVHRPDGPGLQDGWPMTSWMPPVRVDVGMNPYPREVPDEALVHPRRRSGIAPVGRRPCRARGRPDGRTW